MTERKIVIGGASGGWGDSPRAVPQLLRERPDYLMMDYLAEVTMSLLARARQKDPELGYVPDFVSFLAPYLGELRGTKVITNAGGTNPRNCRAALERACRESGVDLKIAVVEGDDVLPLVAGLAQPPEALEGLAPERLISANAYLGAWPIAAALRAGADVVITGRCADSALALAPLIAEFGWQPDEYDKLAAGSLLGHVIECGPHATGGIFTDWAEVPGWENIGYPLAACNADGTFEIYKPAGTGGMVNCAVIAEQILYEVGDPAAYVLPDVIADFTRVTLEQIGPDRVAVQGAKGHPATSTYKVSGTYQDGFRLVAFVSIVGVDATAKAERTAEALILRGQRFFQESGAGPFSATHIEVLGSEASYGSHAKRRDTREVVLRLVLAHPDRRALDLFGREVSSMGLGGAPGTTGYIGGRAKAVPTIRLRSWLIAKSELPPSHVQLNDEPWFQVQLPVSDEADPVEGVTPAIAAPAAQASEDTVGIPLLRLAHARSGDKGNASNIAIIARREDYFPLLREFLTPSLVAKHFSEDVAGAVERFEAPGLHGLNFLLHEALGGGGMSSMRIDPQGKAFGQRLLEMELPLPRAVAEKLGLAASLPA
ncbi:MAG: DUF1446 domain-containing protein [Candidatus Andeanibacterium colombiense]|uniref:DUF1446 domain-containing protein n=1 Tax=Candidatus Andeanibacterium colombiense TaxID=3121345 RepID=A0AAJ6BMB7_9SPHN|nr:MAG: DUF1446 domain-containing protein [Sphingomonadaceae bacterium]